MISRKYIFQFVCDQDSSLEFYNSTSSQKIQKIKLLSVGEDNKEIKFHGSYFGSYIITDKGGGSNEKPQFMAVVHCADGNCGDWADKAAYISTPVSLEETKVKVVLDDYCEYQIALSVKQDEWVTLPRSSLFSKNLNLKKYYNKEITLSKGESQDCRYAHNHCYVPKIIYDEEEVCKLVNISVPICTPSNKSRWMLAERSPVSRSAALQIATEYIVVERNKKDLLIYYSDHKGNPVDMSVNESSIDIKNIYDYHHNVSLRSALLENSNIREVLPELEIDDDVSLVDTRQLKCSINKANNIQKIASELVVNKKDELGQAVLEAKDTGDREILVNSPILQEGIAEKLRENPGNTKGPQGDKGNPGKDGISPSVDSVAQELITNKVGELGRAVLDATDGSGQNLATQVASKVNLQPENFVSKIDGKDLTQGIVNKLTLKEAKEIVEDIVNTIISEATRKNNPDPEAFKKYEKFAEKLAELLVNKSNISKEEADNLIKNKVDGWGLARYLILRSGLNEASKALPVVEEKVDKEKLAKWLLHHAKLEKDVDAAKTTVENIVNHFFSTKVAELGKAILNVERTVDGHKEPALATDLANNRNFQASVAGNQDLRTSLATNLQGYENFKKDVAIQLLTDEKKDTLVTKVASNETLQEAVAGNTNLQAGVAEKLRQNPGNAKGPQGDKGEDANPVEVAKKLANNRSFHKSIAEELIVEKANALGQAILSVKKTVGNDEKPALETDLANNGNLQKSVAGNLKNDGGVDIPKIVDSLKPKFTLQKGEILSEGIYEANVVLNDTTIATLPKIGYYMRNDQLVMHNYATQEKMVIPEEFHYLKVVRLGSGFGNDDYKLTFCNIMGNEFFEYKKYDPEYSRVSDEYKFISLSHAKKEYNPNLSELVSHRPLFFIAEGHAEPGPDKYAAAVFELTRNGKGKKMATLIDEFGYFNQNGKFMHCNYHKETQCLSYTPTPAKIDEKYHVTDADSEFYLTEYDNISIHAIPEL